MNNLKGTNELTLKVYDHFSIQAELGDRTTSYSQPFFLSKTLFSEPNYSFKSLEQFFKRTAIKNAKRDYLINGLVVLRATIMNPYIYQYKRKTDLNLIKEFIIELHKISRKIALEQIKTK